MYDHINAPVLDKDWLHRRMQDREWEVRRRMYSPRFPRQTSPLSPESRTPEMVQQLYIDGKIEFDEFDKKMDKAIENGGD